MKNFMDDTFMLQNATAVELYHQFAESMPILDYHCHLNPQEIVENKRFKNLAEAWLYGDHYKWRAMRANGVEERFITGGEGISDYDRFLAWTRTVPMTMGNPLYHWSHLELRRIFGIFDLINEANAPLIWEKANTLLAGEGFAAQDIIRKCKVEVICTTDDPADTLEYHLALQKDVTLGFKVLPTFRPDKGLEINRATFLPWVEKMQSVSGIVISSYDQLLQVLEARVRFFHTVGCRISDHALDYVPYAEATKAEAAAIFAKALQGTAISLEEEKQYKTYTLLFIGKLYAELDWAMQYHINAHRNNNSLMFGKLGPDTGYDSINDSQVAYPLVRLLNSMACEDALPRTILYSLNAQDNDVLASIMGSFQGGGIPGKIQLGSAWWFNDTKEGMIAQLKSLASMGLLSRFVGMLTDSRSFLSYTRHEYFRRILCNLLGEWVEQGEAPYDMETLGEIVRGICADNAREYFKF
ncbi:MAG: glucuronate isomerase [Gorillibacterium sp.]|nr:glucuronate isomerase [Gorillibacterium sp.]